MGRIADTTLMVDITLRLYPGTAVVAWETRLRNFGDGPVSISNPASLYITCRPSSEATFSVLRGGAYDDGLPPRGYALWTLDDLGRALSRPRAYTSAEDGRSTGDFIPWFALQAGDRGIAGAMLWSGHWQMTAAHVAGGVRVVLGLRNFEHVLPPGGTLHLPVAILWGFTGGLDDASHELHEWQRHHLAPSVPEDWPWVQYNHWYAYEGDIDEGRLMAEAELAAKVGCEVFVIDDGWFAGRRPESYVSGWGNWVEDRSKFPSGLRSFGDRVRSMGMRFGLWVEPERVDMQGSLASQHPDWLATRDGIPITRTWGDEVAGHLCLGNPDAQEWMSREIIRVVQEYGVDWLKWDYNMGYGPGCNNPDHGHQSGDGHYAHTLGLYRVLSEIRRVCPGLVIENCASGGHRADLGMLRYTHAQWLSDYTYRAASCRQHAQGAGYFLPLLWLNTWVLDRGGAYECRSRMCGAFGVSTHLGSWDAEEIEQLSRAVSEYKAVIRPLLAGRRYLLTSPWHEGWDVWQLSAPDASRFALLAFRASGQTCSLRVIPQGLSRDQRYLLHDVDGDRAWEASGEDLSRHGVELVVPAHGSLLISGVAVST